MRLSSLGEPSSQLKRVWPRKKERKSRVFEGICLSGYTVAGVAGPMLLQECEAAHVWKKHASHELSSEVKDMQVAFS